MNEHAKLFAENVNISTEKKDRHLLGWAKKQRQNETKKQVKSKHTQ